MTSEDPLPDRCAAQCRDGGYCTQYPVEGSERCRMHGGAADNRGEKNGNYKTGAYSEFVDFQRDSLTESEREAIDAIDFEEHGETFAEDVVREAYAKYLRTGDDRFLREARQWAKEFGVIESPADQLEVSAEVESEQEHSLDEETKDVLRETLRQKYHNGDTDE